MIGDLLQSSAREPVAPVWRSLLLLALVGCGAFGTATAEPTAEAGAPPPPDGGGTPDAEVIADPRRSRPTSGPSG